MSVGIISQGGAHGRRIDRKQQNQLDMTGMDIGHEWMCGSESLHDGEQNAETGALK
jgi:hypothetical protein